MKHAQHTCMAGGRTVVSRVWSHNGPAGPLGSERGWGKKRKTLGGAKMTQCKVCLI